MHNSNTPDTLSPVLVAIDNALCLLRAQRLASPFTIVDVMRTVRGPVAYSADVYAETIDERLHDAIEWGVVERAGSDAHKYLLYRFVTPDVLGKWHAARKASSSPAIRFECERAEQSALMGMGVRHTLPLGVLESEAVRAEFARTEPVTRIARIERVMGSQRKDVMLVYLRNGASLRAQTALAMLVAPIMGEIAYDEDAAGNRYSPRVPTLDDRAAVLRRDVGGESQR